jgi:hypothetical protein
MLQFRKNITTIIMQNFNEQTLCQSARTGPRQKKASAAVLVYGIRKKGITSINVGVFGRSHCDIRCGKREANGFEKARHPDGQPEYHLSNPKQQQKQPHPKNHQTVAS